MNKLLLATVSLLAMSSVAKADPWNGLYTGLNLGYSWGNTTTKDDIKDWCSAGDTACIGRYVGPFDYSTGGIFGGGTVGWNFKIDRVVLSPEAEFGYMDLSGTANTPSSQSGNHQVLETDGGFYTIVGGRAGFLLFDNTLVYGKAGYVYYDGDIGQTTTAKGYVTHGTGGLSGVAFGGGVEQMLSPNFSVKVEYLHIDFGSEGGDQTSISDPPIGHVYKNTNDLSAESLKASLVYHF